MRRIFVLAVLVALAGTPVAAQVFGAGGKIVGSGIAAPNAASCDASREVNNYYLQTGNPASVPTQLWSCVQTGASSYAWNPVSHKTGTTAPAICVIGQVFFDSNATPGQNWFGCTSANVWTLLSGSGGATVPASPSGGIQFNYLGAFAADAGLAYVLSTQTTYLANLIVLGNMTGALAYSSLSGVPSTFVPSSHASNHKNLGSDEVATATPGANLIVKAEAAGTIALGWIPALPNSKTTATAANTPSAIMARDGSGNFAGGMYAGNVTGALTGNADTVTNGVYVNATNTMTGYTNFSGGRYRLPEATFVSPPGTLVTGQAWLFTDASAAGICSGGGTSFAQCRWSGAAWVSIGGGGGGGGDAYLANNQSWAGRNSWTPTANQAITAAGNTILCDGNVVQVTPSANLVLTSTPHIAAGTAGQLCVIVNLSASYSLTFQDESILTGSSMRLFSGANAVVRARGTLVLRWNATHGWAQEGGGTGGGSVELTDFKPTAAGALLVVQGGRARIGNYAPVAIALGTATFTAGSGDVKVFIDSSNNLVCHMATGIAATTVGALVCSNVTTPAYPANSIPIADLTITAVTFAVTIDSDDRAFLTNRGVSAATGISISDSGGVASIGIDTASVPLLGAANAWTAANDFTAATNFYIRRGAGVPVGTECDAAAEVGQLYARSDASAASSTLYVCSNTGVSTWAWEIAGGGGGGAPTGAQYLTLATDAGLSAERVLVPRDGLVATDAGANGNYTLDSTYSRDIVMIDDDFVAANTSSSDYFGLLGWRVAGTTGAMTMVAGNFNHPGALEVKQTAAANNFGVIRPFGYSPNLMLGALGSNAGWESQFTFKSDTYNNTQLKIRVGFYDATNTDPPTDGIWLRYGNSTGCTANLTDATWIYEAKTGAVSSTATGPAAPAVDTWYTVAIRSVTATQVGFKVALGTGAFSTEQTITTNVPTSSLLPFVESVTCDANVKVLTLDRFWYKARLLR